MPLQSSAADPSAAAARPYGLLGLILSLVAIAVLAVVIGTVALFAALFAIYGARGALDLVKVAIDAAHTRSSESFDVAIGITAYLAQILAVLAVARFRGGREWSTLIAWRDWELRKHWKLFCGLLALVLAWSVLASIGIEHVYPQAKDWISPPKETPWIIGFLALAVLFGPIGEELLFRGWMYTSLRASFGVRSAVLVTAVVFALAHWESTHLYALAVFPVGLALAAVRERTGSIAASITFHALYNGVASVLLFASK